ncbi:hypothetical protein Ahy_A02g007481 [Arachis hypogaea]|uniref:Aminotransferase-like plant mobile domain-containing protein n=1 Tax=Arachis hypogaea TaxID=3818 RepID=A0A445ECA3_ARAHY|nr:hypothetical protein Ahy_A02g007481 [Arachis hypogaea]
MIEISLLDVAAITGLLINSPDCVPNMQPERQYDVTLSNSYSDFIANNMGEEGTEVTDNEHVAFLFYWLNAVLFCSRSVQMSKLFLPLTVLLHEKKVLNLAKLLLGHVFEELNHFVHCLQNNSMISTGDFLWLLQLWLNAIFEKFMTKPGSSGTDKQHIKARQLGFSQAIPTPFPQNNKPLCQITLFSQRDFDFLIATNHQHKDHFNFLVYDRSSYITKSYLEWWTTYYFTYNRTLEPSSESSDGSEQNIRNIFAASPQSEDTDDSDPGHRLVQKPRHILHSPTNTQILESNFSNNQAVISAEDRIALDSDSVSQVVETTNSDSSRSKLLETPQGFSSPPQQAEFQTPPGSGFGNSGASTTPTNATLANLISVLNRVIQKDEVHVPSPTLSRLSLSGPFFELDADTREQLRSLLKLLDHSPIAWIKEIPLNQLLTNFFNSTFTFPGSTPYSVIV